MKILPTGCGLLLSLALLGCATTTPGLGEETGDEILPAGLTLLDSDEEECDGTVQVAEGGMESDYEDFEGESFIEPGENATFELEEADEDIEWACIDEGESDVDDVSCPAGSTHVRITRARDGGEVLVECFGE